MFSPQHFYISYEDMKDPFENTRSDILVLRKLIKKVVEWGRHCFYKREPAADDNK